MSEVETGPPVAGDEGTESQAAGQPTSRRLGANYFKLLAASTISNLGDGIGMIAYPWLASAVTRNRNG